VIVATLDTGALIAIERRKARGMMLLRSVIEREARFVTTTPVVACCAPGRKCI